MGQVAQEKEWGTGRIQVLACQSQIFEYLEAGYSLKSIHRYLSEQVSISYPQFQKVVRQLQRTKGASVQQKRSPSPTLRNPQQRFTETSLSKPQTFRHDPLASKDYFARGSGS